MIVQKMKTSETKFHLANVHTLKGTNFGKEGNFLLAGLRLFTSPVEKHNLKGQIP